MKEHKILKFNYLNFVKILCFRAFVAILDFLVSPNKSW